MNRMIRLVIAALILVIRPAMAQEDPVQSVLLRAVVVTHDLEATLAFYRDIMGQTVLRRVELDPVRSADFLDVSPRGKVTFITLRGSGEYPGGPIAGGRIGLMAVDDPEADDDAAQSHPRTARQGDMILPHRVANLDEIYRRVVAAGIEIVHPPRLSSSKRSRAMMVYDPNGVIVEMFELFDSRPPD